VFCPLDLRRQLPELGRARPPQPACQPRLVRDGQVSETLPQLGDGRCWHSS
jgi:hypothetical protein